MGRQITFRLAAPVALATLGLAVIAFMAGCGGGGSSAPPATPTIIPSSPAAACVTGTVASYLGTSCSEGGTGYHWSSYTCTSTPSSICTALGTNGSNIQMGLDPKGPYTLLVGRTSKWNVTAGQSVDVVISGTVYGAKRNANWPHFNGGRGQTGNGTEENITTVACITSAACLDSHNGVSDVLCSDTSPAANCTDQSTIGPYGPAEATFNPASASAPYGLTIEIKLNGNSGTASLYSVGTHLIPP